MNDSPYIVNEGGVFFIKKDGDGNKTKERLSSEIHVIAQTHDENEKNWGKLLSFKNRNDKEVKLAIPNAAFAGDGREIRELLLTNGAFIASGTSTRNKFNDYLNSANPTDRALCVMQTGWHDGAFVLPSQAFGEKEKIYYQSERPVDFYSQKGTVEDWTAQIGKYCRGNKKLLFAVSLAFSAPLLDILGIESGGFHFFGPSSCGKSTVLRVAASVYGAPDYISNWRATDNGLESTASAHNDTLLILDEMGQVAAQTVGNIVYMLANEQGKIRADRNSRARKTKRWRIAILSSGEINLNEHMQSTGQASKAGQDIRLIGIPAVSNDAQYGIFDTIHEFTSGAEFADYFRDTVDKTYGMPFIAFIQKTVDIQDKLNDYFRGFCSKNRWLVPNDADGQIKRAQLRFCLVAFAGELATRFGITGWESGEATTAAEACFNDWIATRGGLKNQEHVRALHQVKLYFEENAENFVKPNFSGELPRANIAGYKDSDSGETYILPEVFKSKVLSGLHQATAKKALVEAGWLIPNQEENRNSQHRKIGNAWPRVYVFSKKVLEDDIK